MPKMQSSAGAGLRLDVRAVDDAAMLSPTRSQAYTTSDGAESSSSDYIWPAASEQRVNPPASTQIAFDRLGNVPRPTAGRIAFRYPNGTSINHPGSRHDGASRSPVRGGLAPSALRRVRDYIEANLEGRIELADLAVVANLSRHHFATAFKQAVGCPPHRYVMMRRLASARLLLWTSDLAIVEIALTTGFADQSHFSRRFRTFFGVSPLIFRRSRYAMVVQNGTSPSLPARGAAPRDKELIEPAEPTRRS